MSQITGQEVPASMVAQLTPEMLKAAQKGTYTPVVAGKAQNLLGELVAGLGGEKMQAAAGGCAGTVGTTTQETAARDVYGTKASGILGEVSKAQAAGQTNIQNIIASWKNIKGIQFERWNHAHGCRKWFNMIRDTSNDKIHAVYKMGEKPPAK